MNRLLLTPIALATLVMLSSHALAQTPDPAEATSQASQTPHAAQRESTDTERQLPTITNETEFIALYKTGLHNHLGSLDDYSRPFVQQYPQWIPALVKELALLTQDPKTLQTIKQHHSKQYETLASDFARWDLGIEEIYSKYKHHPALVTIAVHEFVRDAIHLDTVKAHAEAAFRSAYVASPKLPSGGAVASALAGLVLAGTFKSQIDEINKDAECWGGPCEPVFNQATFETPEYTSQYGLGLIKASGVYQYGGFGDGVVVAVFDTGIRETHEAFKDRIVPGYDYANDEAGGLTDEDGHGSHVAGIIAGNKDGLGGTHGVAYQAKVMPFRVIDNPLHFHWNRSEAMADAIGLATTNQVKLFNHSWGIVWSNNLDVLVNDPNALGFYEDDWLGLEAAHASIQQGAVHVWAAGNSGANQVGVLAGLPHHTQAISDALGGATIAFEKGWLAVVAVGSDGTLAPYSNQCGVAQNWCLAAPGSAVKSAGIDSDSSYVERQGTSMAAPHVAGAIAALKSRFPNLSFQQVRDRILVTANDTGIYANTLIYGQGLLDLEAAARPVGQLTVPQAQHTSGSTQTLASSHLKLPAGTRLDTLPAQMMVLDSFQQAPFYLDTQQVVTRQRSNLRMDPSLMFAQSADLKPASFSFRNQSQLRESLFISGRNAYQLGLGRLHHKDTVATAWPSTLFNSSAQSLMLGYTRQHDQHLTHIHAWSAIDPTKNLASSASLSSIGFMPQLTHGTAVSHVHQATPTTHWVAGMSAGNTSSTFGTFEGRGAFQIQPTSAWSVWAGLHLQHPTWMPARGKTSVQLTQWNVQQELSNALVQGGNNVAFHDVEISSKLASSDAKTALVMSLGWTQSAGGPAYQLSIPTGLNAQGQIGYTQTLLPQESLFQERRGQFKLSHALSRRSTLSAFYGFRKTQELDQLVGVGLTIQLP